MSSVKCAPLGYSARIQLVYAQTSITPIVLYSLLISYTHAKYKIRGLLVLFHIIQNTHW